jgi:hypothetical protein
MYVSTPVRTTRWQGPCQIDRVGLLDFQTRPQTSPAVIEQESAVTVFRAPDGCERIVAVGQFVPCPVGRLAAASEMWHQLRGGLERLPAHERPQHREVAIKGRRTEVPPCSECGVLEMLSLELLTRAVGGDLPGELV